MWASSLGKSSEAGIDLLEEIGSKCSKRKEGYCCMSKRHFNFPVMKVTIPRKQACVVNAVFHVELKILVAINSLAGFSNILMFSEKKIGI